MCGIDSSSFSDDLNGPGRPPGGALATMARSARTTGTERALGIYTKSSSPPPIRVRDLDDAKHKDSRRNRYRLQAVARKIAIAEGNAQGLEFAHNYHRVAKCKYIRCNPEVRVKMDSDSAFYSGLTACGSVWACPICASKVQQTRRDEIRTLIEWARSVGKQAVMITFTFPHHLNQHLDELLAAQAEAFRKFRSGKSFQKFKSRSGFVGLVRSLEVTFGRNGWHPHTHELWILDADVQPADVKLYVQNRWLSVCQSAGLVQPGRELPFLEHSVDYHFDADESDYFAKQDDDSNWSIAEEMTLSAMKGQGKTVHPFALLEWASKGDRRASSLFLEYMQAMHGKRQLYWSQGLKEAASVTVSSDEEAAEREDPQSETIAVLECFSWKFICDTGARALVLDLAESGGFDAIEDWLQSNGYNSFM